MATKHKSNKQQSAAAIATSSVNPSTSLSALSFNDIAEAGIIRNMSITLANGKEGKLFYRAMSVRESREFGAIFGKEDSTPEENINRTKQFLASYLVNPDGSQFATEEQLDRIALDDLMLIFNNIANSMSGNITKGGSEKNDSGATVN